ncbi:pro-FMRFamide-related neuropeptide VF [Anolis carolinensis]|uniref:Neuropeptide VF n=1 Tax=Anolis carolinensis TaxID=28377 RepID=G1KN65_ANOCA|nr:PREDICTED: pro-FMRFamide-related neuropeptide VF [Anolis carolinensis]|eukprot:XP_008110878.1 PREDICTED: pro-FMRFamide-related neuropeptide VF [Anolis carolinensis]
MKMISVNRFALFTFTTCLFLTSKTLSLGDPVIKDYRGEEYYDDNRNYIEAGGALTEEKLRSMDLESMNDWELNKIIRRTTPEMKKMAHAAVNLPLRFGRKVREERSIKPAANLPLRFGRAPLGRLRRHVLPFSHRFERAPDVQSLSRSLANLPQRFGRSLLFGLPQETQDSDQDKNKFGSLKNSMRSESNDEEANH